MNKRKKIPNPNEKAVLTQSGRRCCICFAINGDILVKKGQIAHVDRNSANYRLDNLAWLCLEHHAEYDSKTSQHKGWQKSEVKAYRGNLYRAITKMRKGSVSQLTNLSKVKDSTTRLAVVRSKRVRQPRKRIEEFIDQIKIIAREAQNPHSLVVAQEKFRRLSEEIKTYLRTNISRSEADDFAIKVGESPWGGRVYLHDSDPIRTFYEVKITPALSYLEVLATSKRQQSGAKSKDE